MRTYEKHEVVRTIEPKNMGPDPIELMRELAALSDPPPPITDYPSALSVRRSRLVETGTTPVHRYRSETASEDGDFKS